ncbi:hypothetical protein [Halospina sp. K52047b]|uniref:hypothetical protein n=1 Tax=Halospina sp. K52047b TaxID=2614160 RepID=UPI00124ACACD|nr:hypothetical protein [Halospina sp. K52047b]KAA8984361.1 hypothetical protein F3089_03135 [Halospina sp. K52047b]
MTERDFQKSREAKAIRYLKSVETPADRISTARDDYDAYWIYLDRYEENLEGDEAATPRRHRYLVEVDDDGTISMCLTRQSPQENENPKFPMSYSRMGQYQFEVTHFYRGKQFRFSTPYQAYFLRWTNLHKAQSALASISEAWYRKRASVLVKSINNRVAVLDAAIELEDQKRPSPFRDISYLEIQTRVQGRHHVFLPSSRRRSEMNKLVRVLESLVESGELKNGKNALSYKTTGKAITSSLTWHEELSRASSEAKRERILILVTFVIAVSAVLQAYSVFGGAACGGS